MKKWEGKKKKEMIWEMGLRKRSEQERFNRIQYNKSIEDQLLSNTKCTNVGYFVLKTRVNSGNAGRIGTEFLNQKR